MRHYLTTACLTISILLLFSCEKDDDSGSGGGGSTPPAGDATFIAEVDGVDFESDPLLVAGTDGGSAGLSSLTASGTYIYSNGDTLTVAITATSFDADAFQTGASFDAANTVLGNYAFGNVLLNNGLVDIETSSVDTDQAELTITDYNETAGTFSGTFSFESDDGSGGNTYSVTAGEFTDVEFD
jgi:hypothetical protein